MAKKFQDEKPEIKKVKKSPNKKVSKKKDVKGPKEGYLKKVNKELKLVKWPEGKEVVKYTIATVVMCLFLCAVFMLLTLLLSIITGGR